MIMGRLGEIEDRDDESAKFEELTGAFERAFVEGQETFKGDLENETYKEILEIFRAY